MDTVIIARALQVLAIVHWIGGVSIVTLAILPGLTPSVPSSERFELIEGRFADPSYWWMHAMVAIWAIFTLVLFVAEPLFLHRWFHQRAAKDPYGSFRLVTRLHIALLTLSLLTVAGAVLGAHGLLF